MLRSLWPAAPIVAAIALAALALGADEPVAALFFSALISIIAALALALPGARISNQGAMWLLGGGALYLIGLWKGWASTGAAEYATLMAGGGVFVISRDAALKPERAETLLKLIISLGAVLGLASFVDFFIAPETLFGLERPYHLARLSGPFLSANTAATFYGMIALLALTALLRALKRGGRTDRRIQRLALPAATLLICASCLFLSGSRAGISLFMISVLMLVSWDQVAAWRTRLRKTQHAEGREMKPAIWRSLIGPGALAILCVVVFGVSGGLYAERLAQDGLFVGDDVRGAMFTRYFEGIWIYPILGSGLGGFGFINDFLARAEDARLITTQNAAHNIAFQWIFQTGLLGALAALAFTLTLLSRIHKGLSRRKSQTLILRAVLIIAFFVFAHGMMDYALEIPAAFWLFTLILAMGAGVSEGGSSGRRKPHSALFRIAAAAIMTLTGGLSLYAGLDRASAREVLAMDDGSFIGLVADQSALRGSAVRLEAIGDRALRLEQPDPSLARTAFLASLSKEPRDGKLWAKLAYANYTIFPFVAGETEAALRQSYYLTPYADRDFISWRLDFMATVWDSLPDDLKAAAERESRILLQRQEELWRDRVNLPT